MSVDAGQDLTLVIPDNSVELSGSHSNTGNALASILWEKVKGPGSYNIVSKNLLKTKITNLVPGDYEFELKVVDVKGIGNKDKISITVKPGLVQGNGELLYSQLEWISPWYYALEIKNFKDVLPPGTPFKVFIQRSNNSTWIEVKEIAPDNTDPSIKYEYFEETRPDGAGMYHFGSLYVFYYGKDAHDYPSIKIQY